MKLPTRLCALAVLAVVALPAIVASEPGAEQSEADRHRDAEEPVCRTIRVTGSHLRKRVCFKQKEWDQIRESSQRTMRERRPDSTGGAEPG